MFSWKRGVGGESFDPSEACWEVADYVPLISREIFVQHIQPAHHFKSKDVKLEEPVFIWGLKITSRNVKV